MDNIKVVVKRVGMDAYVDHVGNHFKKIQELVDGYIEQVYHSDGIDYYACEDGHMTGMKPNIELGGNMIVGTIVAVKSGGSEWLSMDDSDVGKAKAILDLDSTGKFAEKVIHEKVAKNDISIEKMSMFNRFAEIEGEGGATFIAPVPKMIGYIVKDKDGKETAVSFDDNLIHNRDNEELKGLKVISRIHSTIRQEQSVTSSGWEEQPQNNSDTRILALTVYDTIKIMDSTDYKKFIDNWNEQLLRLGNEDDKEKRLLPESLGDEVLKFSNNRHIFRFMPFGREDLIEEFLRSIPLESVKYGDEWYPHNNNHYKKDDSSEARGLPTPLPEKNLEWLVRKLLKS